MNTSSSALSASSESSRISAPRRRRSLASELMFLAAVYTGTLFVGSMFISACGPGCCFVFYSIIAVVSGLLMLRRPMTSRCICLAILVLSLFGMWHEKEARDTWAQRSLRLQVDKLQQELQKPELK